MEAVALKAHRGAAGAGRSRCGGATGAYPLHGAATVTVLAFAVPTGRRSAALCGKGSGGSGRLRSEWRTAANKRTVALRAHRGAGDAKSSRLRRTEARLSGEDVTGAVSRRAVSASARRRRSGVEPLFSPLPFYPLSMLRIAYSFPDVLSDLCLSDLCATASALWLAQRASGRWPFVVSSQ